MRRIRFLEVGSELLFQRLCPFYARLEFHKGDRGIPCDGMLDSDCGSFCNNLLAAVSDKTRFNVPRSNAISKDIDDIIRASRDNKVDSSLMNRFPGQVARYMPIGEERSIKRLIRKERRCGCGMLGAIPYFAH